MFIPENWYMRLMCIRKKKGSKGAGIKEGLGIRDRGLGALLVICA
jgi:hypothetical protein